jgi:bleomycin hydrolase
MTSLQHAPALSSESLERYRKRFEAEPSFRLAQNAVTQGKLEDVALDRRVLNEAEHVMSESIDHWKVTDQRKSGRCWLFAGLNLLRSALMAELKVKDFEFSQSYLMFFDKLERAGYFLEAIIETAGRALDDRTVAYLLSSVADDGGQWNMFIALVAKYGLVPKPAMPETKSSSNTEPMNAILRRVLRQGAISVRATAAADGDAAARARKDEILEVVYRVLSIHLGTPPERFLWQWRDTDKVFHRDGMISPKEFLERYVHLPIEDYVCLVHDPRPSSPVNQTYTVEYLGNVLGAPPVRYLNVEIALMKQLAARAIKRGEPVWFGCDVDQMMSERSALWDTRLFDYGSLYHTSLELTKAERLMALESSMTHAMLFTGVDLVNGLPRAWRVENSWGKKSGRDGFATMNDGWFDEYVFEIAARRDELPTELQRALDTEPVVLPAWDPMGALARSI